MKVPKCCPMCGSYDEWSRVNKYHDGFSFAKAILGRAFLGQIGLLAGLLGKKRLVYICKRCHFSMEYRQ